MVRKAAKITQLQLPIGVVTRADVGHLLREAESIDNFLRQAAIRKPGTSLQLPKSSQLFDEIISKNKLNMLHETDRRRIYQFLQAIKTTAPILHVGFSSDPSPLFQQRLITWIRQQIHPFVLLQIGLQPSIGAGCVVRSTNKYFDFSLRQKFSDQRMLLISKLRGADATHQPSAKTTHKEPVA